MVDTEDYVRRLWERQQGNEGPCAPTSASLRPKPLGAQEEHKSLPASPPRAPTAGESSAQLDSEPAHEVLLMSNYVVRHSLSPNFSMWLAAKEATPGGVVGWSRLECKTIVDKEIQTVLETTRDIEYWDALMAQGADKAPALRSRRHSVCFKLKLNSCLTSSIDLD